jgi:hypothetical protein
MHYKLFLNVPFTTGWAGNSPGIFKDFYERLVTKQEARQYWTMLPSWLKGNGEIEVELPKGHKLDSAITENVRTAVSTACGAVAAFQKATAAEAQVQQNSTVNPAKPKTRQPYQIIAPPTAVANQGPEAVKPGTPVTMPAAEIQAESHQAAV